MTKVAAATSKSAQRLLEFQQNNGYLNDVRLESFGFFLDDYVIYGGDLTFDTVDVYKVLLSESIISLNDQLWRAFIKEFRITKHNTTYYVGFLDEKGYVFGETEPFENYLRLWTIPVDANGNIGSTIDHRSLFGYLKFKAKYDGVYLNVDEVNEAINNANSAADNANQAASDVQGAVNDARDAANKAKDAVVETEAAIEGVNSYLDQLEQVITNANEVVEGAVEAAANASDAAQRADVATSNTNQAIQDVQNEVILMQEYVNELRPEDEYDAERQYYINNIVTFNGSSFIARQNTKGNPPPTPSAISNAYWQLIASQGAQGERGLPGQNGKDGTSINPLGELQSEDELPSTGLPGDMYMIYGDMYIWQENTNTWKNVGPIQGPKGKSAYDLAVEKGFVGTMEEWLESLKGEIGPPGLDGPPGPTGQDGKDGIGINPLGELQSEDELPSTGLPGDMYMIQGDMYVWQENTSSWKNVGPIQGPEGKSAYDLAVENGFVGTMEEWLESLKGEIGPPGPDGPPGPPADLTEINQKVDDLQTDVTEHLGQMKPKVDNSWQKGIENDSNITNLGNYNVTKTFIVNATDWKSSTNVEVITIQIPFVIFSGLIKMTVTSIYEVTDASGGAYVIFNFAKSGNTVFQNRMEIVSISDTFSKQYFIGEIGHTETHILIYISKKPTAKNAVAVELDFQTSFPNAFTVVKDSTLEVVDTGSPTGGGISPWIPQFPSRVPVFASYSTSETENPDTSTLPFFVSAHANLGGGYWYVENRWLGNATNTTSSQMQVATKYTEGGGDMKVRYRYGGVWSAWSPSFQSLKQSVSDGKAAVNQAVTDKGVYTAPDAPFATTAANIRAIPTGKTVQESTMIVPAFSGGSYVQVDVVFTGGTARNVTAQCGGRLLIHGMYYGTSAVSNGLFVSNIEVIGSTVRFTFNLGGGLGSWVGGSIRYTITS
ncbi:pyocin knob domain-containing protein [Lysinibacillus sp. BSL11]